MCYILTYLPSCFGAIEMCVSWAFLKFVLKSHIFCDFTHHLPYLSLLPSFVLLQTPPTCSLWASTSFHMCLYNLRSLYLAFSPWEDRPPCCPVGEIRLMTQCHIERQSLSLLTPSHPSMGSLWVMRRVRWRKNMRKNEKRCDTFPSLLTQNLTWGWSFGWLRREKSEMIIKMKKMRWKQRYAGMILTYSICLFHAISLINMVLESL